MPIPNSPEQADKSASEGAELVEGVSGDGARGSIDMSNRARSVSNDPRSLGGSSGGPDYPLDSTYPLRGSVFIHLNLIALRRHDQLAPFANPCIFFSYLNYSFCFSLSNTNGTYYARPSQHATIYTINSQLEN